MIRDRFLEMSDNSVYNLDFFTDSIKLKWRDFLNELLFFVFKNRYPYFTVERKRHDGTEKSPYELMDELIPTLTEQDLYDPLDPWRAITEHTIGFALFRGTDRDGKNSLWNLYEMGFEPDEVTFASNEDHLGHSYAFSHRPWGYQEARRRYPAIDFDFSESEGSYILIYDGDGMEYIEAPNISGNLDVSAFRFKHNPRRTLKAYVRIE